MHILSEVGAQLGRFASRLAARHRAATEDLPALSVRRSGNYGTWA